MITLTFQATDWDEMKATLAGVVAKVEVAAAEVKAKRTAKEAIEKAASKPEPAAPVADAVAPSAPPAISPPEAAVPVDKAALQKIASAKSKTLGVEKVKELISRFGGKNINTTPDEKLAELQVALEELA